MIFDKIQYKLKNRQKGIQFIRYGEYFNRVNTYIEKETYEKEAYFDTNIRMRNDFSMTSRIRDRVVEEYLHSKKYTFDNIGIILNPYVYAPKTAVLLVYSSTEVSFKIHFQSGEKNAEYYDYSKQRKYHKISIAGLEKGYNNIELIMVDKNENELGKRSFFIYLAADIEMEENPIVAVENNKKSSQSQFFITGGDVDPFVFNENGSIFNFIKLWKYRTSTYGVYPFGTNRFLWPPRNIGAPSYANPHTCIAYEMDFMGRVYQTYHIKNGLHHAVIEMPNGNLVTFSSSNENYTNVIKEGHTEDTIIEIDRNTGEVVRTIYLKDLLGDKYIDMVDWVHGNALEYNKEENSMMICMRNVHVVMKFNWSTCELIWVLSLPELWKDTILEDKILTPVGKVDYSFQAHSSYEVKNYKENDKRYIVVFDNHRLNRRPIEGYQEDGHSYINLYEIDENAMTVKQENHLQIDMSIVRSNARYHKDNNVVLNMSGCLWRDFTEYRGKVEEIDLTTKEVLNRFYIKHDFFSGYEFNWKSDDYATPIADTRIGYYNCGDAERFILTEDKFDEVDQIVDEVLFSKAYIENDYLYFYTKDHSVDYLLLSGIDKKYVCDFTKTWQTTPIHIERTYYVVMSLKGIQKGNYKVKVVNDGIAYETQLYINMKENS